MRLPLAAAALAAAASALLAPAAALPRVADATAPDATRLVVLRNDVSIEQVGSDLLPPFDRLEEGESAYFRVRAVSDGPGVARRGEILLVADITSDTKPSIRGRSGVRCEITPGLDQNWLVLCQSTRKLRDGESLSVLLRIEADERRIVVQGGGTRARNAADDLVVRSNDDRAAIKVFEPPGWTGVWTWEATWPGGTFTGEEMVIRRSGTVACATWAWSKGGRAKGTVTGRLWAADWEDGYGEGWWTLTLEPGNDAFTGTQLIDPLEAGKPAFFATISGRRTGGAGAVSLSCSSVDVRPSARR
ncbi:MAG: hypothetical protein IT201_00935 [Thermoleophilia bacterium]|nr:hypothetical protein [Thermoleophilia bacterium]